VLEQVVATFGDSGMRQLFVQTPNSDSPFSGNLHARERHHLSSSYLNPTLEVAYVVDMA
jgi:hypothetical protein